MKHYANFEYCYIRRSLTLFILTKNKYFYGNPRVQFNRESCASSFFDKWFWNLFELPHTAHPVWGLSYIQQARILKTNGLCLFMKYIFIHENKLITNNLWQEMFIHMNFILKVDFEKPKNISIIQHYWGFTMQFV